MSTLLAISGPHIGRRFTLKDLTRLGRAPDNDIILTGNLVSRYHAEIERNGPVCIVADLGSKNGIYINDNKEVERRLKRGDRLKIGETTLVFEAPQELKTARFTNTLIHLEPDQDETMRVVDRPTGTEAPTGEATGLILKLAQVFETGSADLPEVLENILKHLLELFGATAGSILLRSRDDEVVPLTAIADAGELHLNREATRVALTEGRAVLSASFFTPQGEKESTRVARRAMIVPMFERDEAFGAIHLERPEGSDYTLKDVTFLQALSRLVSGPVRQAIRIDQLGQIREGTHQTILGTSEAMETVRSWLKKVAATDASVLLTGETGTGKELIARAIHEQSSRASSPFVAINCAAIPEALIESELFGHERGSFTGADRMKRGKVEIADQGTLFLDEIGEMQIDLQPKILRFLEEGIYYRVGGVRPIQIDVRVVAATNRDLDEGVKVGRFRKDLLYRLNVVTIPMPPLRDRREDIRTIVNHFGPELAGRVGKPFLGIEESAWPALHSYSWPGNVRELLHSLERALILSDDGILRAEHFQIPVLDEEPDSTGSYARLSETASRRRTKPKERPMSLADAEKRAIIRALRHAKGNKNKAAEVLEIHRNTLRKKIAEYGIEPDEASKGSGS